MSRVASVLAVFLVGTFLVGLCGCERPSEEAGQPRAITPARVKANTAFVAELDSLEFFKGLTPEQADRLRLSIVREGWNALFGGPPHRLNPADAEDLAEGGIPEFIALVRPFLLREKVRMPVIRQEHGPSGYTIMVGEKTYTIYTREEIQRDTSGEEPGLTHGLSMVRGFAIVNDLLAGARSPERLYAVGGGNDLFGMFLTPQLHELIVKHPDASPTDAPYEPKEGYPTFGQPVWQDWHGDSSAK